MSNRLLLLSFILISQITLAQVKVRGLSFWNSPVLTVYQTTNYLSNERTKLFDVEPDSIGIFEFEWQTTEIEQLQICSNDFCSWFFVQPKGRYIIELPNEVQTPSLAQQQEVELLFYKLDTLDINYRILGFEAWMDQYISEIYQLKDLRSNEFISKIRAFKNETAAVYNQDTSVFLKDYIKYSVGLTIDNFSVIGGPTKEDKFGFYLSEDSVNFKQPKLLEYAKGFYQNYFDQLDQANRNLATAALNNLDFKQFIAAYKTDPYIYNLAWAEFVAFLSVTELQQNQKISPAVAVSFYEQFASAAQQLALRQAARKMLLQLNELKVGKYVSYRILSEQLGVELPRKIVCLHYYQPGNQKCISEILALQKVADRQQQVLQIITIYPESGTWSKADTKAFEKVKWPVVGLKADAALWSLLGWQSAPAYILIDREQVVRYMPALGPLPNGNGQTIDTQILQLK
ncbi:MAG: hypothetical protein ACKOBN_04440 [Flavobacteriales bacterium]